MTKQEALAQRIHLGYSALLDLALSILILMNPERFGTAAPWIARVQAALPKGLLEELRHLTEELDLFELAYQLEQAGPLPVPEALAGLDQAAPDLTRALLQYWAVISPEVGAQTGLITQSLQAEAGRLAKTDALSFITHFSDRVRVEGRDLVLEWGKGMRIPLAQLTRIQFIPSVFSPRRLMFYRIGDVQLFFYAPQVGPEEELNLDPPESMTLGFGALADTTRLKLLRLIATQDLPAQEMAQRLAVNESTVSRHLRLLVEAGLVGRERNEGKHIFYSLHASRVERLVTELLAYLGR